MCKPNLYVLHSVSSVMEFLFWWVKVKGISYRCLQIDQKTNETFVRISALASKNHASYQNEMKTKEIANNTIVLANILYDFF